MKKEITKVQRCNKDGEWETLMDKTETSLSEKEYQDCDEPVYHEKDVREAVLRLKKWIEKRDAHDCWRNVMMEIDEIFGEKLI